MMFYRDDELPFIYQIKKRLLDRERKKRKLKGKEKENESEEVFGNMRESF